MLPSPRSTCQRKQARKRSPPRCKDMSGHQVHGNDAGNPWTFPKDYVFVTPFSPYHSLHYLVCRDVEHTPSTLTTLGLAVKWYCFAPNLKSDHSCRSEKLRHARTTEAARQMHSSSGPTHTHASLARDQALTKIEGRDEQEFDSRTSSSRQSSKMSPYGSITSAMGVGQRTHRG